MNGDVYRLLALQAELLSRQSLEWLNTTEKMIQRLPSPDHSVNFRPLPSKVFKSHSKGFRALHSVSTPMQVESYSAQRAFPIIPYSTKGETPLRIQRANYSSAVNQAAIQAPSRMRICHGLSNPQCNGHTPEQVKANA
jgi:hypothetical protein